MAIPDYQTIMLPLLKEISDGNEHPLQQVIEALAQQFSLSDVERKELLPSGGQFIFHNRVGWARTYLKKAGMLSTPRRGIMHITDRGLKILSDHPKRIDTKFLRQFPEFLEFQGGKEEPQGNRNRAQSNLIHRKPSKRDTKKFARSSGPNCSPRSSHVRHLSSNASSSNFS